MPRGRTPKPTAIKALTGNPGKRPLNHQEPIPPGVIGDPPEHLSDGAKAAWRLAVECAPPGLLTQSTQVKVFNSFSASWIYEVFAEGREVLKGFPGDGKFVRRSGRADCAAKEPSVASNSGAWPPMICSIRAHRSTQESWATSKCRPRFNKVI